MSTVSGGDGAAADPLPLASEARDQPAGDKIGVVSSNTAVPALPAPAVHLVDDEAAVVRDALSFLLRSHGLTVVACASAPELLAAWDGQRLRGCLLLDVRMAPMSGLQLHAALIACGNDLPVVFLTGHGDIPMAVEALQKRRLRLCRSAVRRRRPGAAVATRDGGRGSPPQC